MDFKVVISKDENGVFTAECLELPGCISDGKTRQEAKKNIKQAIEACLESIEKHGEKIHSRQAELVRINVCT